jgi:sporulation protein YlmC with PRC-barrel domain
VELSHPDDALSTLIGARVVDPAGKKLGRVRDVEARWEPGGSLRVVGLRLSRGRFVPWAELVELRDGVLVARGVDGS